MGNRFQREPEDPDNFHEDRTIQTEFGDRDADKSPYYMINTYQFHATDEICYRSPPSETVRLYVFLRKMKLDIENRSNHADQVNVSLWFSTRYGLIEMSPGSCFPSLSLTIAVVPPWFFIFSLCCFFCVKWYTLILCKVGLVSPSFVFLKSKFRISFEEWWPKRDQVNSVPVRSIRTKYLLHVTRLIA